MKAAREYKKQQSRVLQPKASKSVVQCFPLTRSMTKIIDETVFTSENDVRNFYNTFIRKYSEVYVLEMINRIRAPIHAFSEEKMEEDDIDCEEAHYDDDEYVANISYHGDLDNYEDGVLIDKYIEEHPIQLARKGNTITGPKSYNGKMGYYSEISYKTGDKGDIDFKFPWQGKINSDTVLEDSEVDLLKYINKTINKTIDKTNRTQHFAYADKLYATKNRKDNASWATNFRKGQYTWHHLKTPYKMVLVDMTVHAKHGHNGGVYLW